MGLHVAVLGGGFAARVHLAALASHPGVEKISLAESNPENRAALQKEFRLQRCEADLHALLEDKSVDVADICLPHDLHYPVTMEAFAEGKHVLLEKPISNTLAEADEMLAAAGASGWRFFVALNERFIPAHRAARDFIRQGLIGQPVLANFSIAGSELERMRQPYHWKGSLGRAGGGAAADSGTHIIDLMFYLFGEPLSVCAQAGKFVVREANKGEDTFCALFSYPTLIANLSTTYASAGQPWTELRQIFGTDGAIHIKLEGEPALELWQGDRYSRPELPACQPWWQKSVSLAVEHAVSCIINESPFEVRPEDARVALKTVRAVYRSARTMQAVPVKDFQADALSFID